MWPGEEGRLVPNIPPPLFSIFPPFSRSIQVSRLLPEYNLNWCSFWGTCLTTSVPEHKEHTYFSFLLCLRKLCKKKSHFCLFLKFWTEIEEYLLKKYSSLKVSPRTDSLYLHSPVSGSYPGPCCYHIFLSSERERDRQTDRPSCLLPGSQGAGIQGRWCGPGSPKWGNSKRQHWASPLQSLLSAS